MSTPSESPAWFVPARSAECFHFPLESRRTDHSVGAGPMCQLQVITPAAVVQGCTGMPLLTPRGQGS